MSSQAEEDCRDYLRTGRCKYGPSCKYRHPPNVQSGGGIKTPLNPSEPPFPIRPNEPPCQYYLKHGICKFGQACKFNHPPQPSLAATLVNNAVPGATVLMNVGSNAENAVHRQMVVNGSDAASMGMMLQFLPQRPNEPDCIYFLRNGRCKYGATCRYHHPIQPGQASEALRSATHTTNMQLPLAHQGHHQSHVPMARDKGRSHSFGSIAESFRSVPQDQTAGNFGVRIQDRHHISLGNPNNGGPTHILVSDGPISVLTLNNQGTPNAYEHGNRWDGQDLPGSYVSQGAFATSNQQERHGSNGSSPLITSSSIASIASSYETASSSFEYLADLGGTRWSRNNSHQQLSSLGSGMSQRTASIGNLSAHGASDTSSQGHLQSAFESNPQLPSAGARRMDERNLNSHGLPDRYHPVSMSSLTSSGESSAGRGSSFSHPDSQEQRAWQPNPHLLTTPDRIQEFTPRSRAREGRGVPTGGGASLSKDSKRSSSEFDDDGMTQMTSALLNLMDISKHDRTPNAKEDQDEVGRHHSAPSTPLRGPVSHPVDDRLDLSDNVSNLPRSTLAEESRNRTHMHQSQVVYRRTNTTSVYHNTDRSMKKASYSRLDDLRESPEPEEINHNTHGTDIGWSPTWPSLGQQMEQSAQSVSVLQTTPGTQAPKPHVGLFLS